MKFLYIQRNIPLYMNKFNGCKYGHFKLPSEF